MARKTAITFSSGISSLTINLEISAPEIIPHEEEITEYTDTSISDIRVIVTTEPTFDISVRESMFAICLGDKENKISEAFFTRKTDSTTITRMQIAAIIRFVIRKKERLSQTPSVSV